MQEERRQEINLRKVCKRPGETKISVIILIEDDLIILFHKWKTF